MKKERLVELDVMRGLAFLCIVIQHTIGGFSYSDDITFPGFIISKLMYIGAENGVEIFVFLTAVSLIYTYYDNFNIKDFYIKKLKFLVLPFVIWSIIILIEKGEPLNFQSILVIFTGDAQYHLWYMGMILRIYLYFPLILWCVRKVCKANIYIKSIIFALLTFLYWYILNNYGIAEYVKQFFFKNPTKLEKKVVNVSPAFYYLYFVIGAYAVCSYKKFKEFILNHKILISVLYLISYGFYNYVAITEKYFKEYEIVKSSIVTSIIYRTVSIIFFYMISCIIKEKSKYILGLIKLVSRYSFPAYLLHVMVINSLTSYIPIKPEFLCHFKLFVYGTLITVALCWILNYIPYSEYIIGVKSRLKIDFHNFHKRNSESKAQF